jgi:hypothetical protein
MISIASWLQAQLRPAGQWRDPTPWAGNPAARAGWRHTAEELAARMPDLADQLHDALQRAHARGAVLAPTAALRRLPGQAGWVHGWQPAPAGHRVYQALGKALRKAGAASRDFAAAAGIAHRPGLVEAITARKQAYTTSPVRLAGQWYPRSGMAEPTRPVGASGHTPALMTPPSAYLDAETLTTDQWSTSTRPPPPNRGLRRLSTIRGNHGVGW